MNNSFFGNKAPFFKTATTKGNPFFDDCCTSQPIFGRINKFTKGSSFLTSCCNGQSANPQPQPPPVLCGTPTLEVNGFNVPQSGMAYSLGSYNPAVQGVNLPVIDGGIFTNTSTEVITVNSVTVTTPAYPVTFSSTLTVGTTIAVGANSSPFDLTVNVSTLPTGVHKINVVYQFVSANCPSTPFLLEYNVNISSCQTPVLLSNLAFSSVDYPPTLPYVLSQKIQSPNINNQWAGVKVNYPDVTQGVATTLNVSLEYDNNETYNHVVSGITQIQEPGFSALPAGITFAVVGTFPYTVAGGSNAAPGDIGGVISIANTVPVGTYEVCIQFRYTVCGKTEELSVYAVFEVV